jgi:hypothetical protein
MQADDAAHAPTADLAGVIDNLITDACQKEDQCAAALARVAELESELLLWRAGVTIPTLSDCWRQFEHNDDICDLIGKGIVERYALDHNTLVIRFISIDYDTQEYIFETPWDHFASGQQQPQIRLQTHMLHKLCLVNKYYFVKEVQGASGNIDDVVNWVINEEDDYAGCKWILQEKYTEEELDQLFENGQILPNGQFVT